MESLIVLFVLIPLLGFMVNAIIPDKEEARLAQVSFWVMGVQLFATIAFTTAWVIKGAPTIYFKEVTLLHLQNMDLFIDFKFDIVTAVYLIVGAFIAFLITAYSRSYLHLEPGFKRFFTTILFFYLGYNLIVVSGNLTTIFVGWEIAGISSFLLIAYYRNRYIPLQNAIKIFSLYRVGDICIMLAIWLSHYIWHRDITLNELSDIKDVIHHVHDYPWASFFLAMSILVAASIKSAIFPFSAWLPRAMEGPTPSSAIFYSSLAVHLGVLVLLRTYSFWSHVPYVDIIVIVLGVITFVLATLTARIQPSIKGQIAYAIVAQTGLMFVEVALGLHILVLIHFASHAMLRSYQLLISPSIVSYSIKKQFYEFEPVKNSKWPSLIQNLSNSVYVLSLKEWYLDSFIYYFGWEYFHRMGVLFQKIPRKLLINVSAVFVIIVIGLLILFELGMLDVMYREPIVYIIVVVALIFILRTFVEKERTLFAWYKIAFFHFFLSAAMHINGVSFKHLMFYIAGILISYLVGHLALNKIRETEKNISMRHYNGHCYEYPNIEFWFFLSCLGLMGFPITTGFVGVELLLTGVKNDQIPLLVLLLHCFLINGLAMMRMYTKIFLGPHVKTYHEAAGKFS